MTTSEDVLPVTASERVEAEMLYAYLSGSRSPLGADAVRLGGGVVTTMTHDETRFWNRAIGFTEPITADLVDEVLDRFRAAGSPTAVLLVPPAAQPADFDEICTARGLRPGIEMVKFVAPVGRTVPGHSGLRIERVAPDQAADWAELMMTNLGMPQPPIADLFAARVGHPNFDMFVAWDGPAMAAAAAMYIDGEVANLHGGATAPAFRNRGAQSALIAARIAAAEAAGCRWVVSETLNPAPGTHNSSYSNMLRAGFTIRYLRREWTWNPEGR